MKKNEYFWKSLLHAAGVLAYIAAVAALMFNGEAIFGQEKSFLIPIFLLLLFVISAAVTGLLVLGRPITLYLGGQKKQSFVFLFSTLAWLAFFAFVVAFSLILLK